MAKTIEKHEISDGIYIYKADNSSRWFARFKINSMWKTKSTKEKDIQQAIFKAVRLQTEYQIKADNDLPIFSRKKTAANTFVTIAKNAIKRMEQEKANGSGKVVYNDYIQALNKYHIPYFDKVDIKDIDLQALMDFDEWRIAKLGRVPAKSTINTHNSAMQRVFDEAVIGKHITASELPVLKNEGVTGKRRAAFSHQEYFDILEAVKNWIPVRKKKVTTDTFTLLYYYIQFSALTGARPGKEIDNLTWGDVHKSYCQIWCLAS